MILIWKGWGFAVALFVVIGVFIGVSIPGISAEFSFAIGLALAAVATYALAAKLGGSKERLLVDPATNEQFVLRDRSSLFFIPIMYWSYILLLLSVFAAGSGLIPKH